MGITDKELFKRALSDAMNQKFEKEIIDSRHENATCSKTHTEIMDDMIGKSNKPKITIIVPPDTPGIIFAIPIKIPPKKFLII